MSERRAEFDAIKAFYADCLPQIMAAQPWQWAADVAGARLTETFSPIELVTWQILRSERVVMYPQFPVGPWFVDFGNPHVRIGLECDGKMFHQDLERDDMRAADLRKRGWRLIRLTGAECWEEMRDEDDQEGVSYARRVIRDIGTSHGIGPASRDEAKLTSAKADAARRVAEYLKAAA